MLPAKNKNKTKCQNGYCIFFCCAVVVSPFKGNANAQPSLISREASSLKFLGFPGKPTTTTQMVADKKPASTHLLIHLGLLWRIFETLTSSHVLFLWLLQEDSLATAICSERYLRSTFKELYLTLNKILSKKLQLAAHFCLDFFTGLVLKLLTYLSSYLKSLLFSFKFRSISVQNHFKEGQERVCRCIFVWYDE